MKSLVRCEWGTLRTFMPSIAVTMVLVCVFLALGSGEVAGVCGAGVAATLIVASSFAGYDEQNGWMRYRCAMPFSRRELAEGRYVIIALVGLVMSVACLVLARVTVGLMGLFGCEVERAELVEMLLGALLSEGFGLVVVSVALPFYFKFGAMRGVRIFACAGLVLGGLVGFAVNFATEGFFSGAVAWIGANAAMLSVLVTVVSLVVYVASCALSVRILERKDL